MSDNNVTPIKPGASIPDDLERQFVTELGAKVRGFVEANGHLPDCAVIGMWSSSAEGGMSWAASYFSPAPPRGRIEVYGTAIGIFTKSLARD